MGVIFNFGDEPKEVQPGKKITLGKLNFIADQFGDLCLQEPAPTDVEGSNPGTTPTLVLDPLLARLTSLVAGYDLRREGFCLSRVPCFQVSYVKVHHFWLRGYRKWSAGRRRMAGPRSGRAGVLHKP